MNTVLILGKVKIKDGSVQYQKNDGTLLSVAGTWDWKNTSDKEKKPQQEQTQLQQPLHRMRSTMTDMELLRQKYLSPYKKQKYRFRQ